MISVKFTDLSLDALPKTLAELLNYWRALSKGSIAPRWRDFDMLEIPSENLPLTMVKDVENDPRTYRYRFYGSKFAELNRKDLTGMATDDVAFPALARALKESLDDFVNGGRPRFYRVEFVSEFHIETAQHLFRLPISDDKKNVTAVVSVVFEHVKPDAYHKLIDNDLSA